MSADPLIAHSLGEVHLYLMVTPCPGCGQGPLVEKRATSDDDQARETSELVAVVEVVCRTCKFSHSFVFTIRDGSDADQPANASPINPGDGPSRMIDVGQWITLSGMIAESAAAEADKLRARMLKIEASHCLGEALKFYDDPDNDLPPPEAFFCEPSQARFREAPSRFSRRRLIDLRATFPSPTGSRR